MSSERCKVWLNGKVLCRLMSCHMGQNHEYDPAEIKRAFPRWDNAQVQKASGIRVEPAVSSAQPLLTPARSLEDAERRLRLVGDDAYRRGYNEGLSAMRAHAEDLAVRADAHETAIEEAKARLDKVFLFWSEITFTSRVGVAIKGKRYYDSPIQRFTGDTLSEALSAALGESNA